ncbi:MAG: DMT family transporter, partial [Rikenellaceae bacterium]
VIRTLQPIIVIAIGALFFHNKISIYKIIGICLGIAGTVYISITPHHQGVQDSFLGDLFIFIATLFTAFYLIVIRPYAAKFKTVTIMKWMSLSSVVVCVPFGYRSLIEAPMFHNAFSWVVWGEFAYSLIFASMVAAFISVLSLRYISAFVKSTYIYLLPITGTLVAILLKIQYPTWHDPIAFVIILIGFALVNKKSKEKSS